MGPPQIRLGFNATQYPSMRDQTVSKSEEKPHATWKESRCFRLGSQVTEAKGVSRAAGLIVCFQWQSRGDGAISAMF